MTYDIGAPELSWWLPQIEDRGFADTGDDEYYRNAYHAPGHIRETWGRDFEVLEILPAFVANMQDLVCLRPRA